MLSAEDDTPSIRDLNRYVTKKRYATEWKDIGIELGLALDVLEIVKKDHHNESVACFQNTLDKWLKLVPGATWKALEVALTNVRRQGLGLDPVDDVYGEDLYVLLFCINYTVV